MAAAERPSVGVFLSPFFPHCSEIACRSSTPYHLPRLPWPSSRSPGPIGLIDDLVAQLFLTLSMVTWTVLQSQGRQGRTGLGDWW